MTRVLLLGYDPDTVDFSEPCTAARHDRREGSSRYRGCDEAVCLARMGGGLLLYQAR